MALPRGTTGSLWPTFVSARPVGLAVRRASCQCTRGLISDQLEPTIARLRYSLGGDRPSQTTRHAGSRARVQGPRLDIKEQKGGISRAPPCQLAPALHRLPPILHIHPLM